MNTHFHSSDERFCGSRQPGRSFSFDPSNVTCPACLGAGAPEGRTLAAIAAEIVRDWPKPYFGAVPYLGAMRQLGSIKDNTYGADSAKSIVLYFMSNANGWRGPVARRIKTELKALCKGV